MKILVIGDYISDVYTFGTATRLCPEAPVPVIVPRMKTEHAGGAGLVCEQLTTLGADTDHFYFSKSRKHRFFAGTHLVCRVDEDSIDVSRPANVTGWFDDVDAFVISDYGKGALTRELAQQIVATGKPCFVDSKKNWGWYPNSTIFPNQFEIEDAERLFLEGRTIPYFKMVVRKLGAGGCELTDHDRGTSLRQFATVNEVVDVTGAGDIFMASFVYAWSLQLPAEDSLRFANTMAGESCRHVGTYVVPKEFAQKWIDGQHDMPVTEKITENASGCEVPSGEPTIQKSSAL